jgi:Holliday junction resolvasome RuvABC DNA-binding subunit
MHVAERRRTVQRHFMEKLEEDAAEPKVAPAQRMKLDAVRGALKELGYKKYEFEPVVSGLDPTLSEELLVRDAVKQLHAGSN